MQTFQPPFKTAVILFLCIVLVTPVFSFGQTATSYNVMFIAIDDMNEKASMFGYPQVLTPNLQRLANHGVVFKRAYCQFSLCNPSRTSLLSGWRPDKTGIFTNTKEPRSVMGPDVKFLPEYFSLFGYHTERIGKIMHSNYENDITWDYPPKDTTASANNTVPPGEDFGPGSWWINDVDDKHTTNGKRTNQMLERMRLPQTKPFFFALGLSTHNPFTPSLKYWNMYGDSSVQQLLPIDGNGNYGNLKGNVSTNIQLPNTPTNDRADIPPIAFDNNNEQVIKTTEEWQNTVHAYYAEVTQMDAQLGLIFDEMDKQNLWQNTIVVLWGDHGQQLGEHEGTWLKNVLFEESDLAPLIICVPGKAIGTTNALVEFVDIYPTLTELCGLPMNVGMEGTSFAPLFDNLNTPWKKAAFTQVKRDSIMGRAVSTKKFRYNSWGSQGEELYDHSVDPFEYTNLVTNPDYAKSLDKMRRILAQGWTKSIPPNSAIQSITSVDDFNDDELINKTFGKELVVYPNPSKSNVFVQFTSKVAAKGEIRINDVSGKSVFIKSININAGSNNIQLQLSKIAAGFYYLEIKNEKTALRSTLLISR